ncbi:AmmeMemoRadiSam system protein A [Actinomyces dentalis]|uniref:AmmeMemoRadiSam system protein A n=1 Tax=Actinomyces dentalis TaxID=272548 RepID=UPI000407C958|nr:AmmeMemoRadiSam system protein A [Actinomyces dentalis]
MPAMTPPADAASAPVPPADAGLVLLPLARGAIAARLDPAGPTGPSTPDAARPDPAGPAARRTAPGAAAHAAPGVAAHAAWLDAPGASFVTLTSGRAPGGALRGCIGSLEARRPLRADVEANAVAAALHDPRFAPLTARELDDTVVEVSVLSVPAALPAADEAELLARLRPGVDGVVLSACGRRATFLPQVWEQLPDPADFLARLRRKAGLPADYWGRDVVVETYTVTAWQEAAPGVVPDGTRGRRP